MKSVQRLRIAASLALLAGAISVVAQEPSNKAGEPANHILARELAIERGDLQATALRQAMKPLPGVSGGVMQALHERLDVTADDTVRAAGLRNIRSFGPNDDHGDESPAVPPVRASGGCPNVFRGDHGAPDNIRVNQDCTLRRQAEEMVVVNPLDSRNLIAGQNDSRIGFNHCGYDWSLNRARSWGDTGTAPPPFWGTLLASNHTADACSDPSATFDHLGNAYITGVLFDIVSPASAILVAKSNAPYKGLLYHTPRQIPFQQYSTEPLGQPANDNDPDIAHDKELMIADSRPSSPKKGRVYLTWTRFETTATPVGGRSPIVFSQSVDGGATWSRAVIVSGAAASFCTVFSGTPGNPIACDQDQGSNPVVGPDGTVYVIFGNGNTPGLGINQVLMVRCPATKNCDVETDWEGPFRVGDLITTHPTGDAGNAGGCPVGRQCLPPNGYRYGAFTNFSISVDRNSTVYAVWADHRNATPNCGPIAWSVARPPCNHDVFYAFSANRGTTWSPTINVTPRTRFGETAQWQPWSDVMGDGSVLQAAFYDRQYGGCELTGCNDITLASIWNPRSTSPRITYQRITTASMPNLIPATNPVQAGFIGDYMWVEVSRHNFDQRATHIVWADTRPLFGTAPEEDVYYARVGGNSDEDDDHDR
jgi:hypothetical protein